MPNKPIPTILDLAGVQPRTRMQARSLLPALRGEAWQGRDYVFAEHPPDGVYHGDYMTMIRSERWKLVHFLGQDYGQLFDLAADPGELKNLWHVAELADVKREFLDALLNWRIESGHATRNLFEAHR